MGVDGGHVWGPLTQHPCRHESKLDSNFSAGHMLLFTMDSGLSTTGHVSSSSPHTQPLTRRDLPADRRLSSVTPVPWQTPF